MQSKLKIVLVVIALMVIPSCGTSPLKFLTGGGPNVAANTQVGKTNTQTVGTTNNTDQTIVRPQARDIKQTSDTNKVSADRVETVVVNEIPPWVLLLLILGWLLPSPGEMGRSLANIFRRKT